MSDELPVEHEEANGRGRYVVYLPDGSEAEMTYQRRDANTIIVDHTGVPPQHRNLGLALKLVERGIADARATGSKIVPASSKITRTTRKAGTSAPRSTT
jgi:predicted GNAT family acetyltransferase